MSPSQHWCTRVSSRPWYDLQLLCMKLSVLLESDLSRRRNDHTLWGWKAAITAIVTSKVDFCNSLLTGSPALLVLNAVTRPICNRMSSTGCLFRSALRSSSVCLFFKITSPKFVRLPHWDAFFHIQVPALIACDDWSKSAEGRASVIMLTRVIVLNPGTVFLLLLIWPTHRLVQI